MNNETIYLLNIMAARPGGALAQDCDRIFDAKERLADKSKKKRNLKRANRHYTDSRTLGRRQRDCATFAHQPKDLIARSFTMRREIVNQGVMYLIISLFVFLMMPLLRFVS